MPVLDRQNFSERTRDARIVATASDDDIMALYQELGDPIKAAEGARRILLEGISAQSSVRRTRRVGLYWLVPVTAAALIAAVVLSPHALKKPQPGVTALLKPLPVAPSGASTNPDQVDTLLELAVLELTEKHYKKASDAFRRAYELDAGNVRALLGIAEVYFQLDQPEKAVQAIADAVKKWPERLDLKKELANAEFRAKRYNQAIADFQSIIDRYKDAPTSQAEIYGRIGFVEAAKGDPASAIENLQKARQLDPANAAYISQIAQALEGTGRQSEAMAAYRDVLKIDPNNPVVLNNLAYLIAATGGDLDEALDMAQRANQQLPNFPEVSDTIGWIYLKKNQNDRAVETFRDLIDKVTENPTFHHHYAMALAQQGDDAGALRELQTALQYGPPEREEAQIKALIQEISDRR